jgi:hypothetical protein
MGDAMTDTKQPEALRLADELETDWFSDYDLQNAAEELRRLHEVNQELLRAVAALRQALAQPEQEPMVEVLK